MPWRGEIDRSSSAAADRETFAIYHSIGIVNRLDCVSNPCLALHHERIMLSTGRPCLFGAISNLPYFSERDLNIDITIEAFSIGPCIDVRNGLSGANSLKA